MVRRAPTPVNGYSAYSLWNPGTGTPLLDLGKSGSQRPTSPGDPPQTGDSHCGPPVVASDATSLAGRTETRWRESDGSGYPTSGRVPSRLAGGARCGRGRVLLVLRSRLAAISGRLKGRGEPHVREGPDTLVSPYITSVPLV
jgi:hypothetical protein